MKWPLLFVCAATALLTGAPMAKAQTPTFEQRVQVEAIRNKSTRVQGGDFDDRTDRISFTLKLTNTDTKVAFNDCKAEFFVFAQSILNRKAFQLLGSDKFDFSLAPRAVHSFTSTEVVTMWDKTGAKFGSQYDSWVLVVRDKDGKVLLKKSTSPSWLPVAEKLGELKKDSFYERDLKPVKMSRF